MKFRKRKNFALRLTWTEERRWKSSAEPWWWILFESEQISEALFRLSMEKRRNLSIFSFLDVSVHLSSLSLLFVLYSIHTRRTPLLPFFASRFLSLSSTRSLSLSLSLSFRPTLTGATRCCRRTSPQHWWCSSSPSLLWIAILYIIKSSSSYRRLLITSTANYVSQTWGVMLIGRVLLILLMRSTFIIAALTITTTTLTSNHQQDSIQSSTLTSTHPRTPWKSLNTVADPPTIPAAAAAVHRNECQHPCSIDHCLQHLYLNKNCTKLIRDQCDCCTVCLRTERETCGGYLNVYGLCEQDLLCYASNRTTVNLTDSTGICVKGREHRGHVI